MSTKTADLIIAISEHSTDMLYATHFAASDAFVYFKIGNKKMAVLPEKEIEKAKLISCIDKIFSKTTLNTQIKNKNNPAELADIVLKKYKIKKLRVPHAFSIAHAQNLKKLGYKISVGSDPFYPERLQKTPKEKEYIKQALRGTEKVLKQVIDIIKRSKIKNGKLYFERKVLTAEYLQTFITTNLYKNNLFARESITTSAKQTIIIHERGYGPIYANKPIILDIFPQHLKTFYCADITRTIVKGKAHPKLKKMYKCVKQGQNIAFSMLRAGINAKKAHMEILNFFEKNGFKSGEQNGVLQGFVHNTGHGLGMSIHEPPIGISPVDCILKKGYVLSVEPGLYYADVGGVRLEDLVFITKNGCENLTKFPKFLEVE